MQRLERTEKMMVRWMCGVSLKNQRERSISTENLRDRLGIDSVTDVVQHDSLGLWKERARMIGSRPAESWKWMAALVKVGLERLGWSVWWMI